MRDSAKGATGRSARAEAVNLFMRPRSVALVGVSAKPRTAGRTVLSNLKLNGFAGDVHLIGRSDEDIEGHKVLASVDDLPMGVDLAVFALPAAGVTAAMQACARRGVKAVTIFSSGFAEIGNRGEQESLAALARASDIAMLGPNCLGYTNLVDGLPIGFANARKVEALGRSPEQPAVAMVSQSGGLMAYASMSLAARNLPMSYTVSTGNEAGVGLAHFIDFFVEDEATSVIALYLEEVRDAQAFMEAAARARAAGKPIVAIHPGRGARGKAAIQSHTGALADDYATMRVHLARAGVALVDTLEELVDVVEILARYPTAPTAGPGVLTFSGGFCAIAHDYFEDLDLTMPDLTEATTAALTPQLPSYIPPKNPLDLGTQAIWQPELTRIGTEALMADASVGSVLVAINSGTAKSQELYGPYFVDAMKGKAKLGVLAFPAPDLDPGFEAMVREHRLILSRSIERSMKAIARVTHHGRALERADRSVTYAAFEGLPALGAGTVPEWRGKELLAALGIAVPAGGLATSVDEAAALAARVGYPVALKAQAAALAHKTEAGGVVLGLRDEAALRAGWETMQASVAKAQPGLVLDGVLVERMAEKGLELMIGARRDPKWGPVLLVGLGGIWVEALGDVRLMAADAAHEDIVAEIWKLRSAKLLAGVRGAPAVDVEAVARTAALVGRLMMTVPEIDEIDLNPVFVHAKGHGLTAVDALIIMGGAA